MAVDSDSSSPSPNKRLKALATTSTVNPPFNVDSKSNREENSSQICVICFSEDGKSDAGQLDCCDHYFCFVCIMEWAKIESKCPSCKRRFSTICRLPIHGSRQRAVEIPVRDQMCDSTGNRTSGFYDPYAHVRCTICNGMEDDSLMLLCDLCDSASHTYCVGLGTTVPEGDWFCRDCDIKIKNDCARNRTDLDREDQILTRVDTRHRFGTTGRNNIAMTSVTSDRRRVGNGSRTLHRCRNIHTHIRALRANWHDLRKGSVNFPSSSSKDCSKNTKNDTIGSDPSTSRKEERGLGDVDKAWKMLKIAKAMTEKTSHINSTVESSCTKVFGNRQYEFKDQGRTAVRNQGYLSFVDDRGKNKSLENDEQTGFLVRRKENSESNKGYTLNSSRYDEYKNDSCGGSVIFGNLNGPDEICSSGKEYGKDKETNILSIKSEIQSLVKINLKLLSGDKKLGIETFKKVARLATHRILAACGLEPWKPIRYSVPILICNHEHYIQQKLRKASIMPNCCQECFYVVVKNIVKTTMEERVGCERPGS